MKKAIPILIVLAGLGIYVYFFHVQPTREYDPTVRGSGTIEVTDVVVSPKIPAHIESIAVREGDKVDAGQLLATLKCDDIKARVNQANAQVLQAQAAVAQAAATRQKALAAKKQAHAGLGPLQVGRKRADREYKRAEQLVGIQGIPQRTVDEAKSALEVAEEQLLFARQGIEVSGKGIKVAERTVDIAKARLELARSTIEVVSVQLEECTMKAPLSGVVMQRNYEPSEMVLPGAAMFKIADSKEVHTWIYVPNKEIGRVRVGQRVNLVADTYPGREFVGKVVRINEKAEFTPKSTQTKEDRTQLVYGVKVALDNPDGMLMAGMPVEASFVH